MLQCADSSGERSVFSHLLLFKLKLVNPQIFFDKFKLETINLMGDKYMGRRVSSFPKRTFTCFYRSLLMPNILIYTHIKCIQTETEFSIYVAVSSCFFDSLLFVMENKKEPADEVWNDHT